MENYKIYCNLKSELKKKKKLLSALGKQSVKNEQEIQFLEVDIEEDLNALNIIFNHIILQHGAQKADEVG